LGRDSPAADLVSVNLFSMALAIFVYLPKSFDF